MYHRTNTAYQAMFLLLLCFIPKIRTLIETNTWHPYMTIEVIVITSHYGICDRPLFVNATYPNMHQAPMLMSNYGIEGVKQKMHFYFC